MRNIRGVCIVVAVVMTTASVAVGTVAPAASAAPRWAPASKATIHPGVRVSVCTANFVFYDSRYVYLGVASTCAPSWGAKVKIEGASRRGTIVYDSGVSGCCGHPNDFALVRLHNADKGKVNPSVPFWGGPRSGGGRSKKGNPVYSYGNFASPSGSTDRSPKVGVDTSPVETNVAYADEAQRVVHSFRGDTNGGWTHYAQMVLPATGNYQCEPTSDELCGADLGAPVLDARGRALGVLGPWAHDTSSSVTDLTKALASMKWKTNLDGVRLATGTTPFVPPAQRFDKTKGEDMSRRIAIVLTERAQSWACGRPSTREAMSSSDAAGCCRGRCETVMRWRSRISWPSSTGDRAPRLLADGDLHVDAAGAVGADHALVGTSGT